MKNLIISSHSSCRLTGGSSANAEVDEQVPADNSTPVCVECIGVDTDRNMAHLLCAENVLVSLEDGCIQSGSPVDTSPIGNPIDVQHIPALGAVCIITSNEVFMKYAYNPEPEFVGDVDGGILAAKWSPDTELLIVINGANQLLCLTKNLDVVYEQPVNAQEFGAHAPINVGWGSKETQFQGKAGKLVNQPKVIDAEVPFDDQVPRISWRGDGQYFVTSTYEEGRRVLRMWEREGTLSSTSERVGGLEQCLAWKPSGNLIASSQRLPHRHDIVFFERNGLRHGEFTLPFAQSEVYVRDIFWNCESNILAVWAEDLAATSTEGEQTSIKSYLQLWTVGNYHWYLKQQLSFDTAQGSTHSRLTAVAWHPEQPFRLYYATNGGVVSQLDLALRVTNSSPLQALVPVVDGAQLLLTPFDKMVVPPPMSASTISLSSAANCVAVSQRTVDHSPNSPTLLGVITTKGQLCIFTSTGTQVSSFDLYSNIALEPEHKLFRHLVLSGSTAYVVTASPQGTDAVHCFSFGKALSKLAEPFPSTSDDTTSVPTPTAMDYVGFAYVDNGVFAATCASDNNDLVVETAIGTIFRVSAPSQGATDGVESEAAMPASVNVTPYTDASGAAVCLPACCYDIFVLGAAAGSNSGSVVGLTQAFQLVVNDNVIATDCNSVATHRAFLVYTTNAHTCRFLPLTNDLCKATQQTQKQHEFDHTIRAVERGSHIVCVPDHDIKVVLQMPRGNLEAIFPRALVLHRVKDLLDNKQYRSAFLMLRKHRMSLNLLYDHNPTAFQADVYDFVKAVRTTQNLNLFIVELKDEDTSITMYSLLYDRTTPSEAIKTKTRDVCSLLRGTIEAHSDEFAHLFHSVLTTHIKVVPMETEKALARVLALKEQQPTEGESASKYEDMARAALKYLLLMVDVSTLYNEALGSYNLEFALMVAQVANMDPKEYIPFLNELKEQPLSLRCYAIDLHLKQYAKALAHLAAAGDEHFDACVALVKEQSLYTHALHVFSAHPVEQQAKIASLFGDYLLEQHKYEEAAVQLARAGRYSDAIDASVSCLAWQQALELCYVAHGSESSSSSSTSAKAEALATKVVMLARQLGEGLTTAMRYDEAATVLLEYADDIEEAVEALVAGKLWSKCFLVCAKAKRSDLVETVVVDGVASALNDLKAQYTEITRLLNRHTTRLEAVRKEKALKAQMIADGLLDEDGFDPDNDLYSDTTSVTGTRSAGRSSGRSRSSRRSRSSTKSSRGRRKHEAKKTSLKEGGEFEEQALINEMAKLIGQVEAGEDAVRSTLVAGVRCQKAAETQALQDAYDTCLRTIQHILPRVWLKQQQQHMAMAGVGASVGMAVGGMSLQAGQAPSPMQALLLQQRQQNLGTTGMPTPGAEEADEEDFVPVAIKPTFKPSTKWRLTSIAQPTP
eukprot:m.268011 g.268011  ORF g.268011 m.268011 type:complete len:1408 (-) comp15650_c0_seq1:323-4546(-)